MKLCSGRKIVFCIAILMMAFATFFPGGLCNGICNAASGSSKVRVGSELEFSPYAFIDESGQPAGFSVDLIKAVADAMGLSIEISTGPWDTVWNALVAGRLDVLPLVAKLPERQPLVDFSLPHTETYDAFFVRKGSPPFRDIEGARGKEIVVMRSDAAHHVLIKLNFQGRLILVDTIPEGLSLIASGKHDAFLCSKLIGTMSIKKHALKGLTVGPPIADYKRIFSFAVKKGDTELLEKLNQGLLIIRTNGEYSRIYEKWLTTDDPWRRLEKYIVPTITIVLAIALIIGVWLVILQLLVKKRTRELAEKNEMLRLAQEGLEEKVNQRTAELSRVNASLQTEILERKQAQEALSEALDRAAWLARFPEQNPNPVVRASGDGTVLYCNPVTSKLSGWKCEVGQVLQKELLALVGRAITEGNEVQEDVQLNGRTYIVWVAPFPGEGYANIYGRDISERKRAEEVLAKMEEILSEGQKIAHLGTFEYIADTQTTAWSEEEYRIYGLHPGGESPAYDVMLTKSIHPDDAALLSQTFTAALESGSVYELEHRIVRPDGSVRWVYNRAHPHFDQDGKLVRFVGATLDITDRKLAEEALKQRSSELQKMTETLEQRVQERTIELAETNRALRELSIRLISAQEEERKKVAGELHDTIGSCLTGIKFKVESALEEMAKTPEAAVESLNAIVPVIREAVEECRRIQMDLRPSILDDLGLLPTLSWFFRGFQKIYSAIHVEQEMRIEESELPDSLKIIIYRVIQEAMNNIAKHSKADLAHISLRKDHNKVELTVTDNGQGFNTQERFPLEDSGRRLGLTSMRERTELSGGSFAIDSVKGKGTSIHASWTI